MAGTTYQVSLIFKNTQTGETESLTYQFDPVTLDQAKWNGAFGAVKPHLDALVARSAAPNVEPPVW